MLREIGRRLEDPVDRTVGRAPGLEAEQAVDDDRRGVIHLTEAFAESPALTKPSKKLRAVCVVTNRQALRQTVLAPLLSHPEAREPIEILTRAYERARYANETISPDEAAAAETSSISLQSSSMIKSLPTEN